MTGSSCSRRDVIPSFFNDAPWCNIPSDRQGEILVEPLYPRGRLMGGSSLQNDTKVSKLTALAAARRKKENVRPRSGAITSSVALLDKLGSKMSLETSNELAVASKTATARPLSPVQVDTLRISRKYPVRERDALNNDTARDTITSVESIVSEKKRDPNPLSIPIALPSAFARTILGQSFEGVPTPGQNNSCCGLVRTPYQFSLHVADAKMDAFAEPSPDDVILKAQTSKGLLHGNRRNISCQLMGVLGTNATKSSTGGEIRAVTNILSDLAMSDVPKLKSKNLDVLAEFERTNKKPAANFVVIGK